MRKSSYHGKTKKKGGKKLMKERSRHRDRETTRSDVLEALAQQRQKAIENATVEVSGTTSGYKEEESRKPKHIPGFYYDGNSNKYFRVGREV